MTVTLDNFVLALSASGLLTAAEVENALVQLAEKDREDAQAVAHALVTQGKITSYQARELLAGRTSGLVLGNYVLLDRLGAGGMGLVYKAQHRRMKREVALKTLPPQVVDSPEAVKRFHREVEAAARLTHTNIVTAYDADEAEGVHFLVMQYVEGSDLAHYVRRCGRLGVRKAADYMLQAARGLHYAHQKGVVHRDIKPGNLLLDPDGVVRVLDMGLARFEQEASEAAAAFETQEDLTGTGRVIGTVDYMAPEQTIDAKHVDRRADIYSLGCTLHFLLTGRSPTPDGSLKVKLDWHESGPIPSLMEIRPDVPPELDGIFRRMMARHPDDRYPSMGEVISDLEDCLSRLADIPEPTLEMPHQAPPITVAPLTGALVVPEVVSETRVEPPPTRPARMPPYQEPPRSGETQRSQVRPDATVVEKVVHRSTATLKKASRKERQAWFVAGGVLGASLLGALLLWGVHYLQSGPAEHADWNTEVKQKVIESLISDGLNNRHGRRLYSEVMAVLDSGDGGDWYIGGGLTPDGEPRYLRFRGNNFEARPIARDIARKRDLKDDEIQSIYNKSLDQRSESLVTLVKPRLALESAADGTSRLRGSVDCTRTDQRLIDDVVLEVRRRDAQGRRDSEPLASQRLDGTSVPIGPLTIDVLVTGALPAAGDELEICLRAFLYQPQPGIYRISTEPMCRLGGL
jgi:serine/threonine protein kinase